MMPDGDTAAHLRKQVGGLFFYAPEVGGDASSKRSFRRLLCNPGDEQCDALVVGQRCGPADFR
jgi:hypothetical protein